MKSIFKKLLSVHFQYKVKHTCKSCGIGLKVNGKSKVTRNTEIGHHVNFNGIEISGWGSVKIGNYFHSGKGCHIITHIHNYDHGNSIPYDDTYINKNVVIEDCVWLGEGVTILGRVTIGEGAIIQAYSTVVNDIPKYSIAGGHPAKVFKYRDIEHFKKLKQQGKYY